VTKPLSNPTDGRQLFIVRFWHEDSEGTPGGQWRGSVEHAASGERAHFVSLDVLNTFITEHLNSEAATTADQDSA
jgi:hypothetical protein